MLDYLRLLRLPNVFTALADVTAGFLLVHGTIDGELGAVWALLAAASAMLYSAGMVLNDVFDIEVDRRERPERPLPSGRIAWRTAAALGGGLLAGGVLSAAAAHQFGDVAWRHPSGALWVAASLAACVLLYDGGLKKTALGPLAMGSCRGLNILLGASLTPLAAAGTGPLGWPPHLLVVAAGVTVYIAGLTWFARDEAGASSPRRLSLAAMTMIVGVGVLACFPLLMPPRLPRHIAESWWWPLMAVLAANIAAPLVRAVRDPQPQRVQAAIKHGIMSLVTLDAIVVLQVSQPQYAVGVICLLVPAQLLGKWIYST